MNTAYSANDITVWVPEGFPELCARRRDLEMLAEYDPKTYPERWDALACDFEEIGYNFNAEKCRERANYYRKHPGK